MILLSQSRSTLRHGGILLVIWLRMGTIITAAAPPPSLTLHLTLNSTPVTTLRLKEEEEKTYHFYIDEVPDGFVGELLLQVSSGDGLEHLTITPNKFPVNSNTTTRSGPARPFAPNGEGQGAKEGIYKIGNRTGGFNYIEGNFTATGVFLGLSRVDFVLSRSGDSELITGPSIAAKVEHLPHPVEKVFVILVVLMVSIIYVNMGCTIDLDVIRQTVRRPVAPVIGLMSQYLFMPLCSYGLGYLLLSPTPSLWLGLFMTGCAPGGGASNVWAFLLGGSLDLSVTMTFVSTVVAFVAMPVWFWLLAPTIFEAGHFSSPPYFKIAALVVSLLVPICIGLAIKRCCPRAAAVLKRLLKPLALFFLVFVMTFGTYCYWFLFKFISWRVAVCSMLLPWFGFFTGGVAATLCRRHWTDTVTISIETGIQNTGLAIGLLKVALSDFSPLGEIAMIVPVAVATFTPLPLLVAYLMIVYRGWRGKTPVEEEKMEMVSEVPKVHSYVTG